MAHRGAAFEGGSSAGGFCLRTGPSLSSLSELSRQPPQSQQPFQPIQNDQNDQKGQKHQKNQTASGVFSASPLPIDTDAEHTSDGSRGRAFAPRMATAADTQKQESSEEESRPATHRAAFLLSRLPNFFSRSHFFRKSETDGDRLTTAVVADSGHDRHSDTDAGASRQDSGCRQANPHAEEAKRKGTAAVIPRVTPAPPTGSAKGKRNASANALPVRLPRVVMQAFRIDEDDADDADDDDDDDDSDDDDDDDDDAVVNSTPFAGAIPSAGAMPSTADSLHVTVSRSGGGENGGRRTSSTSQTTAAAAAAAARSGHHAKTSTKNPVKECFFAMNGSNSGGRSTATTPTADGGDGSLRSGQRGRSVLVRLSSPAGSFTVDDGTHLAIPPTLQHLSTIPKPGIVVDSVRHSESVAIGRAKVPTRVERDSGQREAAAHVSLRTSHSRDVGIDDDEELEESCGVGQHLHRSRKTATPTPTGKTKEWPLRSGASPSSVIGGGNDPSGCSEPQENAAPQQRVVNEEEFMASSSSSSSSSAACDFDGEDRKVHARGAARTRPQSETFGRENDNDSGNDGNRSAKDQDKGGEKTSQDSDGNDANLPPSTASPAIPSLLLFQSGSPGATSTPSAAPIRAATGPAPLGRPPLPPHNHSMCSDPYAFCDPDYADLAGWLTILVWTRFEVIYFLRELSSVQAMVAWSAWYWAWAQDHPRQATVHFALGSAQFWRSALKGDFASPVSLVHFSASGHMMALRSLFRLIVSCVGAAHGALESLNTLVAAIQREAEMTTSDVAAAAAALRTSRAPKAGHSLPHQHTASAAAGNAAVHLFCHYGGQPCVAPAVDGSNRGTNGGGDGGGGGGDRMTRDSSPLAKQLSLAASMHFPASMSTFHQQQMQQRRMFSPGTSRAAVHVPFQNEGDSISHSTRTLPVAGGESVNAQASVTAFADRSPEASAPPPTNESPEDLHRASPAGAPGTRTPWETFSNATSDFTATLMAEAGDFGPPPCQAYNVVEALRVAVLSTITKVSAMVGSQGLPSQIARETHKEGDDWLPKPFSPDAAEDEEDASDSAMTGNDFRSARTHSSKRSSELGLAEGFTVGGVRGLTNTMDAAMRNAKKHHNNSSYPMANNLSSPQLRLGEYQVAKKATLTEGVAALQLCVARTRFFLKSMVDLIQHVHHPPATRHWRRATIAAALIVPGFTWFYTKSPAELVRIAKAAAARVGQILQSYLLVPAQQLHEAIFYVRPGVEERRTSFDRDAQALANIVRDYHEDYYPDSTQQELDALHDYSLDCMRRGVADSKGFGLIEQHYRNAVKHPIRTAIFGDLPRILLIQMSFQALEMSRVTNGMDEVLEGNDLNFKVMALMPVFAAVALSGLWTMMKWRATIIPVRQRMKLIWRSIYRVVTLAEGEAAVAPAAAADGDDGGGSARALEGLQADARMGYPRYTHPDVFQRRHDHSPRGRRLNKQQPHLSDDGSEIEVMERDDDNEGSMRQHWRRRRKEKRRAHGHRSTAEVPVEAPTRLSHPEGSSPRSTGHESAEDKELSVVRRQSTELHSTGTVQNTSTYSPGNLPRGDTDAVTNASVATAAFGHSIAQSTCKSGSVEQEQLRRYNADDDSHSASGSGACATGGDGADNAATAAAQRVEMTHHGQDDAPQKHRNTHRESKRPPNLRLQLTTLSHTGMGAGGSPSQDESSSEASSDSDYGYAGNVKHHSSGGRNVSATGARASRTPYHSRHHGRASPDVAAARRGGDDAGYHRHHHQHWQREDPSWLRDAFDPARGGDMPPPPTAGNRRPIAAVHLDNLSSTRGLNNYEQGMVLVLVHLMRSLADEFFKSYVFYHELMEDLSDLESMQCSRHQRIETLRRMSHTHSFFR